MDATFAYCLTLTQRRCHLFFFTFALAPSFLPPASHLCVSKCPSFSHSPKVLSLMCIASLFQPPFSIRSDRVPPSIRILSLCNHNQNPWRCGFLITDVRPPVRALLHTCSRGCARLESQGAPGCTAFPGSVTLGGRNEFSISQSLALALRRLLVHFFSLTQY